MPIQRITIGRLYNLGSYEHVRYEISAETSETENAETVMRGLEKIIAALAPESKCSVNSRAELNQQKLRLDAMFKELSQLQPEEFSRKHGYFEGTPAEYVSRIQSQYIENLQKRGDYERRANKARELLDSLGGAAVWKDAKLDWELNDYDF